MKKILIRLSACALIAFLVASLSQIIDRPSGVDFLIRFASLYIALIMVAAVGDSLNTKRPTRHEK